MSQGKNDNETIQINNFNHFVPKWCLKLLNCAIAFLYLLHELSTHEKFDPDYWSSNVDVPEELLSVLELWLS